MAYKDIFYYLL